MVPDFVAVLLDGDGSIGFSFYTTGTRVRPYVSVIMGVDDYSVLLELVDFFGCGSVTVIKCKEAAVYRVTNTGNIINNIGSVLRSTPMNTTTKGSALKAKMWHLLSTEGVKCNRNLERVDHMVYDNNREGRARRMNKLIYLNVARFAK